VLSRQVALHDELWPRLVGTPLTGVMRPPSQRAPQLDTLVLSPRVAAAAKAARAWLQRAHGRWPVLIIKGPAGTGRGALGAALAAELKCGVFPVDGTQLTQAALPTWRRELAWHQAVPVVTDADAADAAALGALARLFEGALVLTTASPVAAAMLAADRAIHQIETEVPDAEARRRIWASGLPDDTVDTAFLATRYRFGPGRIASVIAHLTAAEAPVDTEAAVALCRAVPDAHVGGLATRLPPATWDDLVVPAAVKTELGLIETWGRGEVRQVGRAGLACLFHGRPGTGKTLAARAIAGALGLDLYRVDLSQVIDKYIGESEKRLDRVLREAEAAGAILFFDEAEALFAQRTQVREARDRYANLETSFLLQRLEDHEGLTILATNLQANLDSAFHRRLAIMVEFPPPELAERRRLWAKFLPPDARSAAIDVELLARSVPLPGGDIRNAVFGASLIAGSLGETLEMRHLAIGLWRELKKAGRLVDPSVLGPWQNAVLAYVRATP
jgi:SpoVK/Ycf46/Vps4 family AAA+-type ATPase